MATKANALLSISAITKMDITGITDAFKNRCESIRRVFVELGKLAYGLSKKIDRETTWQKHLRAKNVSESNIANATHAFKVIDRYVNTGTISEDRFDALTLRDMQALAKDSGGPTADQVKSVFTGKNWRAELDFLVENGKTSAEAKAQAAAVQAAAVQAAAVQAAADATAAAAASTPATTPAAQPATATPAASTAPAPASTASTTEAGKGTTPAPATGDQKTVPAPSNIIRLDSGDQKGLVARAMLVCDELAEIIGMVKSAEDKAKIETRVKALFTPAAAPKATAKAKKAA